MQSVGLHNIALADRGLEEKEMSHVMHRTKANQYCNKLSGILLVALTILAGGCTHIAIEDCGGKVLGENEPRIRSSHFRMFLADLPAVSDRFLAFAAMSSLAYAEDKDCGTPLKERKIAPQDRKNLEEILKARGWREIKEPLWVSSCEDDVGLYLRVWERTADAKKEVVIAFRGTWGFKDWLYGNAHWFTRFVPMEDQYSRARELVDQIFKYYDTNTKEMKRGALLPPGAVLKYIQQHVTSGLSYKQITGNIPRSDWQSLID